MSLDTDSNQQHDSVSSKQVKDVGDIIGSRKVLELMKQAVKENIASTAYIVSRMYIYSLILHALKYFDFKLSYAPMYGVNIDILKEIVPYEDSFEVRIKVDIRSIDVKRLKSNWRRVSASIKKTDDDSVKLIMKVGKPIFAETWKELEMDHMHGKVDELKEFKVVKEEQLSGGEDS